MKFYLLRHGQQEQTLDYNLELERPDPELSNLGRRQADLLGQRLSTHHILAIYSSDQKRAIQTAANINHHLDVSVEPKSGLREIDMGEVSLKGWDQIAVEYPDFYQNFQSQRFDVAYPGGESGLDVQQRAWPVLREISTHHPQESNLAIVCHGGVIMVVLAAILGLPQERRFGFQIDHCSITIVEYDSISQSFRILSVNDTAHLLER